MYANRFREVRGGVNWVVVAKTLGSSENRAAASRSSYFPPSGPSTGGNDMRVAPLGELGQRGGKGTLCTAVNTRTTLRLNVGQPILCTHT